MRFILPFLFLTSFVFAAPCEFDIPAQTASEALLTFSRQSGIEVLFSFDDLIKVESTAVSGRHEPDEAIRQLLHATGFCAHRNAQGKFMVSLLICAQPVHPSSFATKHKARVIQQLSPAG